MPGKIIFTDPPIHERVVGVQFGELPFYNNAHAGWFWKQWLGDDWDDLKIVQPIQEVLERFGPPKIEAQQIFAATQPIPQRAQIRRSSDQRLVQIQNTRFHLNWSKEQGLPYVEFDELLKEFFEYYGKFKDFVDKAGSLDLEENHWEVTYTNHLFKGNLWNSIADWPLVIKGLQIPYALEQTPESLNMYWNWVLPNQVGRMHATLQTRIHLVEGTELLHLELTCRGPLSQKIGLEEGLRIGHDAIVESFVKLTTPDAHGVWGMKE